MKHRLAGLLLGLSLLSAQAQTLTVSAAASLAEALREIAIDFELSHPGVSLRLNLGASGLLVQQLRQGAPVDVLLTADEASMDQAASASLIRPETRAHFAGNRLVLIEPAGANPGLMSLDGLNAPAVRRIAVGKPASVPAGRYARELLESAGLWAALQPRLVQGDNVRQVLDYVARGEAQAGFVYRTDAATQAERLRVVQSFEQISVRYPGAVTQASAQTALAADFLAALRGPAARAVLARRGFTPP